MTSFDVIILMKRPQTAGILAIACLHNFVINERIETIEDAPTTMCYLPSEPEDENGDPILIDPFNLSDIFTGWSELREQMANCVAAAGFHRPPGNWLNIYPH
jgi:hypothetical protein